MRDFMIGLTAIIGLLGLGAMLLVFGEFKALREPAYTITFRLDTAAKRRATSRVAVTSSLFGLVRPADRIPAYRLSGDATLPGLGPVAGVWREHLGPVVEELLLSSPHVRSTILSMMTYAGAGGSTTEGCTMCGNCMVGCRVGAKNTLVKNYLALAEGLGVHIEPMRTVTHLGEIPRSRGSDGRAAYRIRHEATDARGERNARVTRARFVVVAGGTWGTQSLLHAMKESGDLPHLSDRLGHLTRTNSEALLGALTEDPPAEVDLTHGIAITSSFHPDEDTHVENVRYGRGSNAMGLLSTLLVPGDSDNPRPVEFLRTVRRHPQALTRMFPMVRAWSERIVIGLVMQSRDNSLRVFRRHGRLTSEQGHGEPNPTYIAAGHRAMEAVASRLAEATGEYTMAGGTWGEVFDVPLTAHFLGGAAIGGDPSTGVVDQWHRVFGHPGISITDGSTISANLGVNPSLTITAQAERAMALWPRKGSRDPRPAPPTLDP